MVIIVIVIITMIIVVIINVIINTIIIIVIILIIIIIIIIIIFISIIISIIIISRLFVVVVAFWQANLVYSLQPLWSTLFAAVLLKVKRWEGGGSLPPLAIQIKQTLSASLV